ncbi:MAG: putative lipopolysaccharide heptosyltransferase III [Methylococcales bacterium]|nr:putative lipopolysaccharide heptosyltransferase III [Methylococcales bacterium]
MQNYLADEVDFSTVRRVLIIKLQHLGDVLLTTPVFSVLKHLYPGITVDALIYTETVPMLSGNPSVDIIHEVDRSWKKRGTLQLIKHERELLQQLKARKYDLVINFTDRLRAAWLTRFLNPRYSVSQKYSHKRGRWWMKSFTHLYSAPETPRHTVEIHLDALRRMGVLLLAADKKLSFAAGHEAELRINQLLADHHLKPLDYIVIHPTSRWMFKGWNHAGFAEVFRQLAVAGYKLVITSGPDKKEITYVEEILAKQNFEIINLAGKLTLKELGALIEKSSCFIGLDSIGMHMAAASGTPCIALFGPSDDKTWHPWQVRHEVITENYTCRPCKLDGCGGGKISECLQAIAPLRVVSAINNLLKAAG